MGIIQSFLAEVASTTNENLLLNYLLDQYEEPKVRAYLLNHYLDSVKGTVFRQTQFAEFEHMIHVKDQKGETLTADHLNQMYWDLNKFTTVNLSVQKKFNMNGLVYHILL